MTLYILGKLGGQTSCIPSHRPQGRADGGFQGHREHLGWWRPLGWPSPNTFCVASPSGVNEVNYCRYPVRETQLQWLRYYLQAQKGMAVTSREVERLYVQVNKFALVSACDWEEAGEGGAGRRDLDSPPLPSHSLVEEEAEPGAGCEVLEIPFPIPHTPPRHVLLYSTLGSPPNTKTLVPCFPHPIKSRFSPSWGTTSRKESSFSVLSSL